MYKLKITRPYTPNTIYKLHADTHFLH